MNNKQRERKAAQARQRNKRAKAKRQNERAEVLESSRGHRHSNWHQWSFWGAIILIGVVFGFVVSALILSVAEVYGAEPKVAADCTCQGHKLYGTVQFVEAGEDLKIRYVEAFEDLKVRYVIAFADACGEWQVVEAFPDLKVRVVEAFEDLKVRFVDAFPGML